jgi:hypothetical protein
VSETTAATAEEEPPRGSLRLAGGLLLGGWLLSVVSTLFHPSGDEDDHEVIFARYADSGSWVAVHLGQFAGVLIALAGLLALYRAVWSDRPPLAAQMAAAATVATGATWAVLQGLDGVALKQAVDAWNAASAAEAPARLAGAETLRWLEWGVQSYFRILLGVAFLLFGVACLAQRRIARWIGWTAVLAGAASVAIGIDVGYSGLASSLQDVLSVAFLVLGLAFSAGVLASGRSVRAPSAQRP